MICKSSVSTPRVVLCRQREVSEEDPAQSVPAFPLCYCEETIIMKRFALGLLLSSLGALLAGGTASATTTNILPGPESSMLGTGGILDQIYGLGNLQRVDDAVDQIWFPANGSATAVAKFAAYTQDVGYIPDLNSDNIFDESFVPLFTVPGSTNGIGLGGPSAALTSGNVNFVWALDPSGAPQWASRPSLNSDGLDHMVTWLITGGESAGNYVIAWEDLPGAGDQDFNDVVLEVDIRPIPIPAAVWLFGSGILGLLAMARRR